MNKLPVCWKFHCDLITIIATKASTLTLALWPPIHASSSTDFRLSLARGGGLWVDQERRTVAQWRSISTILCHFLHVVLAAAAAALEQWGEWSLIYTDIESLARHSTVQSSVRSSARPRCPLDRSSSVQARKLIRVVDPMYFNRFLDKYSKLKISESPATLSASYLHQLYQWMLASGPYFGSARCCWCIMYAMTKAQNECGILE